MRVVFLFLVMADFVASQILYVPQPYPSFPCPQWVQDAGIQAFGGDWSPGPFSLCRQPGCAALG